MLRITAGRALAAIVAASFGVRLAAAFLRPTPGLFPDEYTYAELGRSLSETGRPLVRGAASHFPALLQPLLTAPAWLVGDVEVGYRLVQGFGALAMSLAAIPAFFLARRVGLGVGLSLGVGALAVLTPDLVYTSYVASEPIAYPLVLAAVLAGVTALARPRPGTQVAFLVLSGLCAFARVQFVALPLVFLCGVVLLGLLERRVRAAIREQALPLALSAGGLVVVLVGRSILLGNYDGGASSMSLHLLGTLRWAALDAMTLLYASGWIIVPGALVGLALAFAVPRTREERALAAFAVPLAAAMLIEAGLVQSGVQTVDTIQERYVFYLIPILGTLFALYARRGWPHRLAHLTLAAALVVLAVRVPLSTYIVGYGASASPLLSGVAWLVYAFGEAASVTLAVAVIAGVLSAAAVACSRRPRLGTPAAIGAALLAMAVASVGAVAADARSTRAARADLLPANPSWVDEQRLGPVSLLQAAGGDKWNTLETLFWNRSVDRVLLLPGAGRVDAFSAVPVRVGGDGSLRADGSEVVGPLLVDTFGSSVRLRGARRVASAPGHDLWVPAGRPRLELYAVGRAHDGWLGARGVVYLWPAVTGGRIAGRLMLTVRAPAEATRPFVLTFEGPAKHVTRVRVSPGARRAIRIPVCATGPAYVTFRSSVHGFIGLRAVSVHSSVPVFVPGPAHARWSLPGSRAEHETACYRHSGSMPITEP